MKTAIFVNGELRELGISIVSWRFLQEIDCDVYVSTWKTCNQRNKSLGVDIQEIISPEDILKYLPNATYSIENIDDYDFSSDKFYHNAKQTFHWKNCLRMCEESNKHYDQIMLVRPDDFLFHSPHYSKLETYNEENIIYASSKLHISPEGAYFLSDYFFFGNHIPMKKMIDTLPREMPDNIHTILPKHILSLGLNVKQLPDFGMCLVRPTLRGIDPTTITADLLQTHWNNWGNNATNRFA